MQSTSLLQAQRQAIYNWIATIDAGVAILWAYPDEDREDKPFVVLSVEDSVESENENPALVYKSGETFTRIYPESFLLQITYYANDGSDFIRRVIRSSDKNSNRIILQDESMDIRRKVGQGVLPTKISTKWEYIEFVSFILITSSTDDEDINYIETVEYINNIGKED